MDKTPEPCNPSPSSSASPPSCCSSSCCVPSSQYWVSYSDGTLEFWDGMELLERRMELPGQALPLLRC